jgi:rhodanese-related sulfurtransferase
MSDFFRQLPEFLGNHMMMVIIFIALLFALAANEVARLFRGYKEITPGQLTQLINRDNALLVDLSSQAEFEKGHIVGAKHVAMSQFDPENKDLVKVRDLPIAVYCKNGQTSATAAARLVKAGFKQVHVLSGGLTSWIQADLPLAKGAR